MIKNIRRVFKYGNDMCGVSFPKEFGLKVDDLLLFEKTNENSFKVTKVELTIKEN